jgi:MFS family permease
LGVGIFLDKFGIRKTLIILSFTGVVGQSLLAFNSNDLPDNGKTYHDFLTGRLIFGMGMQSMIFVQVAFIKDWFVGKNLNFALGVINSLPLCGEIINAYAAPAFYQEHAAKIHCDKCFKGYGFAFYMGMVLVITCFCIVLIVIAIDYKAQIQL